MKPIEQAIFQSISRGAEHRWKLRGVSRGISACDFAEVKEWFSLPFSVDGDGKNCMLLRYETKNFFFHPLPSGSFLLGQISPRRLRSTLSIFRANAIPDAEARLFFVPSEVLAAHRFNPLRLAKRIERCGFLDSQRKQKLSSIVLFEKDYSAMNLVSLENIVLRQTPEKISLVLQSVIDNCLTVVSGVPSMFHFLSTIIDLFPQSLRGELTFATDLFISPHLFFRVLGNSTLKNLQKPTLEILPESQSSRGIWVETLRSLLLRRDYTALKQLLDYESTNALGVSGIIDGASLDACAVDWSHSRGDINTFIAATARKTEPSETPRVQYFPHLFEHIVLLDSLTARALFGDSVALCQLRREWNKIMLSLNGNELCVLSEEYIRLVRQLVSRPFDNAAPRELHRCLDAIDVLDIFLSARAAF